MAWFINWCSFWFNEWRISLVFFVATLLLASILALFKYRKKRAITPNRILFIGTFISAMAFFLPMYLIELTPFQAVLNSFQHSFRLFALDGDFVEKIADFEGYPDGIKAFYLSFGSVLYAFAPLLTFGFILSFFKNLSAHLKYNLCFWTQAHVFSELNEKTLALATNLRENNKPIFGFIPRILVVFTDIVDKKEESSLELIDDAKELGAILFRKDLASVRFKRSWSVRKVNFYLISEDEPEKFRHAESIMKHYDYKNVEMWLFSNDIRTELVMATNSLDNIKVARVNDIQSLIYHNLDVNGINLFKRARKTENGEKVISAVIIGLGRYGQEMLKALTWYCQVEGYKLKINAFDTDEKALDKFTAMCPELMSEKYNKKIIEGEPYYEIDIHHGVDVSLPDFESEMSKIKDATYIFVCLGNDKINLEVATKIRAMCERIDYSGEKPDIETVIYDSNIRNTMGVTWEDVEASANGKKVVCGVTNYKKQPYNILMTGDLKQFYSKETVIDSNLVDAGLSMHVNYCVEYKKISFTENLMHKEWKEFLTNYGLADAWESYFSEWKEANNIREDDKIELSKAKSGFSFMTSEELEETQKTEDKNRIKELKNIATVRIDQWGKIVYSKFKEIMNVPTLADEWKQVEKAEIIDANKSFRYEYNYRSSIAKAIHRHLRSKLELKTEIIDKPWEELTLDEKVKIGKIEHVRWNAYMRTEGYRHANKRNDLAKQHHNLVSVTELSDDDLRKDA